MKSLIDHLKRLELYEKINIMVLSDHGMASMVTNGTFIMRDYVNTAWINSTRTVYGVTANIYPTSGNVSYKNILNKTLLFFFISSKEFTMH